MTTKTMSPAVEQRFRASARRRVLVDNMLEDSGGFTKMETLEEDSKTTGALIVEGLVGLCGVPTANKRFYGRPIMEREINRLQERIEARSLLSAVDHPTDGKSRIREAGAICVGLRVEADGRVIGKYEIVEESDGGRNLAAFLRRGASIGMSSRGLGSTRLNEQGHHVVGEDFKLHGFDFVADPACKDAYPSLVSEDMDLTDVDENQLRTTFPTLIEEIEDRARQAGAEIAEDEVRETVEEEFKQALDDAGEKLREDIKLQVEAEIREQLREDFATKLIAALQNLKEDTRAVVKSELLSDPTVAGAKRFMEELAERLSPYAPGPSKQRLMDDEVDDSAAAELRSEIETLKEQVAAKDVAINEIVAQQEATTSKARSLGYRLFVERALTGQDHAEQIREMVGDPDQFESAEALRDHVSAVIHQVNDAYSSAEQTAQTAVKLKEHKADLAQKKATLATAELSQLREEMTGKINSLAARMSTQVRQKDEVIAEAADHIERLEAQLLQSRQKMGEADLVAYTARRVAGHPRGADIMNLVESGRIDSKDKVRQLAEEWDTRASEPGGVGERIRRSLGRGRETPTESDFQQFQQLTEDHRPVPGLEGFDTTMGELRALSGIGQEDNRRRF